VPEALSRWFAPKMTVQPGVGGFILGDWGPGLEWKTLIEVWETNRHLRLVETRDRVLTSSPVQEPLEPCRLVEDFHLEAQGGMTVLRLVHSGFGASTGWDHEYEGTRGGWAVCFLRLKHGLEQHRNDATHNLILPALCYGNDCAQVFEKIQSAVPSPWRILFQADSHLCWLVSDPNGSIFTVSVQPSSFGAVAYVEMLLFAHSDREAAAIEKEWRDRLAQLFPAPEGGRRVESFNS